MTMVRNIYWGSTTILIENIVLYTARCSLYTSPDMVFYRKYRCQTLDELVGQAAVKQALKSALLNDKLAHAYLFCGPRGTGKTSTARILAKIVNCESPKVENRPCNTCSNCLSITDGSNMDVVEMDAASNRGIDDIRALRENIKLAPTGAKKKVYIIDEVHMLSGDAFNALLKTLEEPPAHVLFILATTEVQKVPQTILSRVQRLDFKSATVEELKEALERIIKAEKIDITEEALLMIAKQAGGSFRDGVKILDQLSSLDKIDAAAIEASLGLGTFDSLIEVLSAVAERNSKEALLKLVQQTESGVNIKELTLSALDLLRQLLLIKNDLGEQLVKAEAGEEKYQALQALAGKFDFPHLIYTVNCLQNSLEQGKYVSIPSLPLELAVVEASRTIEPAGPADLQPHDFPTTSDEGDLQRAPAAIARTPAGGNVRQNPDNPDSSADISKLSDKWTYVLETVRQYNFSLEALLRQVKIAECNEKNVIIEVPYSFHQRMIEAPKSQSLLESIFSDILGRSVKVSVKLGVRPVKKEDVANVEVAADDEIVSLAAEIFNS